MPVYEFQCKCGLCFELRLPASKAMDPSFCPECSSLAKRKVGKPTSTYSVQNTDGTIRPQSTGFSGFDTDYDRVIGTDSKMKWIAIEDRNKIKREIMRKENVSKEYIAYDENHEYVVIDKKHRDGINRVKSLGEKKDGV